MSPIWAIQPGLRPSQPGLRPSQPGLRPSQPAMPQASGLAGWGSGQTGWPKGEDGRTGVQIDRKSSHSKNYEKYRVLLRRSYLLIRDSSAHRNAREKRKICSCSPESSFFWDNEHIYYNAILVQTPTHVRQDGKIADKKISPIKYLNLKPQISQPKKI